MNAGSGRKENPFHGNTESLNVHGEIMEIKKGQMWRDMDHWNKAKTCLVCVMEVTEEKVSYQSERGGVFHKKIGEFKKQFNKVPQIGE